LSFGVDLLWPRFRGNVKRWPVMMRASPSRQPNPAIRTARRRQMISPRRWSGPYLCGWFACWLVSWLSGFSHLLPLSSSAGSRLVLHRLALIAPAPLLGSIDDSQNPSKRW
jgi:hypothetical protein